MTLLAPEFMRRLAGPDVRTVLLAGCGGGFDFVHALLLYPELVRLGKRVLVGSYSFGDPGRIGGEAPVVFEEGGAAVKLVSAASAPDPHYGPEVHICSFLDERYPDAEPHRIYAYYARAFSVPLLRSFYQRLVERESVDAVVIVDGGSDSLMRGDEEGLGDPIEDAVSVATAAALEGVEERILVTVGLGCDRYNQVSDAASLRAIAELTAGGGFLGAAAQHEGCEGFDFYRACVEHIYARQTFRSVLAGCIISAAEGHYGRRPLPERLKSRVREGGVFLWPLMALLWGFEARAVAGRSLICAAIQDRDSVFGCHLALEELRKRIGDQVRGVENIPRHEEMRAR